MVLVRRIFRRSSGEGLWRIKKTFGVKVMSDSGQHLQGAIWVRNPNTLRPRLSKRDEYLSRSHGKWDLVSDSVAARTGP